MVASTVFPGLIVAITMAVAGLAAGQDLPSDPLGDNPLASQSLPQAPTPRSPLDEEPEAPSDPWTDVGNTVGGVPSTDSLPDMNGTGGNTTGNQTGNQTGANNTGNQTGGNNTSTRTGGSSGSGARAGTGAGTGASDPAAPRSILREGPSPASAPLGDPLHQNGSVSGTDSTRASAEGSEGPPSPESGAGKPGRPLKVPGPDLLLVAGAVALAGFLARRRL